MNNQNYSDERSYAEFNVIGENIMFQLKSSGEEFSADDFYAKARQEQIPPTVIKRLVGKLFREFQAAGFIKKTDRYVLSERNQSTPLPLWTSA